MADARVVGPAAAYAAIGIFGLVRPRLVPRLFGGSAPTAAARTEVRAVYGGLPLAFAAVLARAAPAGASHRGGALRATAVASGGMAAGRLLGAALDRDLPPWPTGAFLALETALAVSLAAAARA